MSKTPIIGKKYRHKKTGKIRTVDSIFPWYGARREQVSFKESGRMVSVFYFFSHYEEIIKQ